MRMWGHRKAKSNVFIASIPEHPNQWDNFNISKLLTQDGQMKARWFNLYGFAPYNRGSNTKSKTEGSEYLGRVLIAFNILVNERPTLISLQGNTVNEPPTIKYQMWVDFYYFVDSDLITKGDPLHIVVSMGLKKTKDLTFTYVEKHDTYKYKPVEVNFDDLDELIDMPWPKDQS
jgi:hypothetical protein